LVQLLSARAATTLSAVAVRVGAAGVAVIAVSGGARRESGEAASESVSRAIGVSAGRSEQAVRPRRMNRSKENSVEKRIADGSGWS
jgi:hypothetical protein